MRLLTMFYTCVVAICFAACSGDEYIDEQTEGRKVNVTLRLSVDNNTTTRAWQDTNAETDDSEMMYNWTVVVVNSSGTVEEIVSQTPVEGKEEIDNIAEISLTTGQKTFYSFANIDISSWGITKGNSLPSGFDNKKYQVNANGIVPPSFGGEGGVIPMSNKQTITISEDGSVDLIVVRMLAKMKFQFTNATAADIKINSITLSEITTGPVYLLPNYVTGGGGPNDMEPGNLLPNIPAGSTKDNYTHTITNGLTVEAGNITPVETTFYINESEATADYPKYFVITLNIDKGEVVDEQRYALLECSKIARNEYHIIPITLDDYILDIEPQDFPPIGVLPASVKEEDGKFTVTFHAGGHFHIVPKVKQASSSTWLEYGENVVGKWSYADWSDDTTTSIYEVENPASTTDASDNGGIPVWDDTNHYIFGKLKQGETGSAYHELKVNVKKSEEVTRELTYKLYIIKE
ncbi:MAG: DUF4906 domain-containing protein [Prevotella sp.]|nr:DUF4906 domain-containing protein [Prevotella sp.]